MQQILIGASLNIYVAYIFHPQICSGRPLLSNPGGSATQILETHVGGKTILVFAAGILIFTLETMRDTLSSNNNEVMKTRSVLRYPPSCHYKMQDERP